MAQAKYTMEIEMDDIVKEALDSSAAENLSLKRSTETARNLFQSVLDEWRKDSKLSPSTVNKVQAFVDGDL